MPKFLKTCQTYLVIFASLTLFSLPSAAQGEGTLYRYTNNQGVKVINSSIPAEYAQKGYEIIDFAGEVLKVVPPAPSVDEIEQANQERDILNTYNLLKRRYSSLSDIEHAKERRLKNIHTSISILEGSVRNLEDNITLLVKQAADLERGGRKVHNTLLKQLSDTRAELEISEELLSYRKTELSETSAKYDDEIRAFIRGEQLEKMLKAANPK